MKKTELTRHIAQKTKLSRAAAADQIDRVVHEMLERLRKGEPASLPGIGSFLPGQLIQFPLRKPRKKARHE
jgi:nucleoid DNA-binding protein